MQLSGHEGKVNAIDFHPTKNILASSGEDGTIRLWSLESYLPLGLPFKGHEEQIKPTHYTHNASGQLLPGGFSNDTAITSLRFSNDGKFMVSGANDGTIRYWVVDPAQLIKKAKLQAGRSLSINEKYKYLGKR